MRCRTRLRFVASCVALLLLGSAVGAADALRISDPVVHANLAIYLVRGAAAGGAVPLSLEEALAGGRVKVGETGSVNELTVENIGTSEVFIQAGDIVKGGRQDRVLSVDLLLPPRSGQVSIAAFCVESGRWTARGQEDSRQFSSAAAAMPSHEGKLAIRAFMASDAPAKTIAPASLDTAARQSEIWATVRKTQDHLARSVGAPVAAPASPSSLQLSLESEKLKEAQAAYIGALQKAGDSGDDVIGYVVAINGKISGADLYGSPVLFHKLWRKQLAASVTEAISEKDAAGAAPPSVKDVESFLAQAESGRESERLLNAGVHLATRDSGGSLYAETRRAAGGWVHRNYLAK